MTMCCRTTKSLLCCGLEEAEEARTSRCCCRPPKVWPKMEGALKEGEVYNFRGGTLSGDWKKSFLVLSKSETDVPLLYLYKDRLGGKIKHEILLPAIAHEIRFGKSCQLYGKFGKNLSHLKTRLPQMIAIPERYCDKPDPYIIWIWIPDETEFINWRRALAESLEGLRMEPPKLEVVSEEGKQLCNNGNLLEWELFWIQLDKI